MVATSCPQTENFAVFFLKIINNYNDYSFEINDEGVIAGFSKSILKM
jgi:hypothetical protein